MAQLTPEQRNAKRLVTCKRCNDVTYRAGMCVCKLTGERTIDMGSCPAKGW